MNKHKEKIKLWLCLFVAIGLLLSIFLYMKSTGIFSTINSVEAFKAYIQSCGDKAYGMFFFIQFMSVIIAPIPSNISAVVGGNVFGLWQSFFISLLAIISGSVVVFILARKLGKPFTEKFVSPKISEKYEKLISSKRGELLVGILFLLPFLPDDAIGFLVGLSTMRLGRYFMIMILTRPWEILAASALGSSNIIIPWWGWGIIAILVLYVVKNGSKLENKFVSAFKEG